ncbi:MULTISPECIES: hypothetical protein [Kitasatospora]|uniref:hypothetical protein n=1 Tax=Kitasatospora TaxID=2063 RepID=UPI0018725D3A|nr:MULTISPECIES: hypothetical protein [Kitasatospora]
MSVRTRGGALACGLVWAAVLTGCADPGSAAPPGSPTSATAATAITDRSAEIQRLRAAVDAPAEPFSAEISVEAADGRTSARGRGRVSIGEVQTSSMRLTASSGDAQGQVSTTTRSRVYSRVDDQPWTSHPRGEEVLLADHRPMVRTLLAADPASYRGRVPLPGDADGASAYHLAGRLPVGEVSAALGVAVRRKVAEHGIADCAADLRVDDRGRLAELSLVCEGDGYRATSTLGLHGYGPPADIEPPADL